MDIHYSQHYVHWNYFLAIEKDFEQISRYVEFAEDNNSTYSIEFARAIMASAQEIDGILKKICQILLPKSKAKNINDYQIIISQQLPQFITENAYLPRFGMSSQPWINWASGKSPDWWQANNNIKHERTSNLKDANLKNGYNAIAALLITTLYYYKLDEWQKGKEMDWKNLTLKLKPQSSLFVLDESYYHGDVITGEIEW